MKDVKGTKGKRTSVGFEDSVILVSNSTRSVKLVHISLNSSFASNIKMPRFIPNYRRTIVSPNTTDFPPPQAFSSSDLTKQPAVQEAYQQ
jgi:hypothetical protein